MNDQELLRLCSKYLIYDPETGIITNRVTRGPSKIGEISGCLEGLGYRRIRLDHKLYLTHRLAFLIINRYLPRFIDHANGDRGDIGECHQIILVAIKEFIGIVVIRNGKQL